METMQGFSPSAVAVAVLLGLCGWAGMSAQGKNTVIGAGAGGGVILTGGSAVGTVGGAAVGGIIGHEVSKPK